MPFERSKNTGTQASSSNSQEKTPDLEIPDQTLNKGGMDQRPWLSPEQKQQLTKGIELHHQEWMDSQETMGLIVKVSEENNNNEISKKKSKNRCHQCRKKLTLVMQTCGHCPCGEVFCELHRHFTSHDCPHDFKIDHKEQLRKNNPVIKKNQLNDI